MKANLFRINLYILNLSQLLNAVEADLLAVVEHLQHPAVLSKAAVVLGGAVAWLYAGAVVGAHVSLFSRNRGGWCRGCLGVFQDIDHQREQHR